LKISTTLSIKYWACVEIMEFVQKNDQKGKLNIIAKEKFGITRKQRLFNWSELIMIFFTHLLYMICRVCCKCMCSVGTGSLMSYVQCRNWYTIFLFVHLGIILILVLCIYSDVADKVRTVYMFSLCIVSLICCNCIRSSNKSSHPVQNPLSFVTLTTWQYTWYMEIIL
jgi:hypothetical protein